MGFLDVAVADTALNEHLAMAIDSSRSDPMSNTFYSAIESFNPTPPLQPSPEVSSKSRRAPSSVSPTESSGNSSKDDDPHEKRRRNTLAARRYRQRRLDRMAELEEQLAAMTSERDELRVQLARREAEVGALKEVLGGKN